MAAPFRPQLLSGAAFLVVAVLITEVATPLVFAAVLDRIATLGAGAGGRGANLWHRFGTLVIAYAVLLVAGQAALRAAGWAEWEGAIRTFANSIHKTFERLLALGYRWHVDHPSGEVASSLSAFAWALVDGIDTLQWGLLRIVVVVLAAIGVLAVVAWPISLVLVVLSTAFVVVVAKRSGPVTEASRQFTEVHSRAEGTVSDVVRNVTTVLVGAGEAQESARVEELVEAAVQADLRARKIFTVTRVWMSGTVGLMTWGDFLSACCLRCTAT